MTTWYPAMNRWRDQTGIAHVLRDQDNAPLCGARPFSFGGGFSTPDAAGCHTCRRCATIAAQIETARESAQ